MGTFNSIQDQRSEAIRRAITEMVAFNSIQDQLQNVAEELKVEKEAFNSIQDQRLGLHGYEVGEYGLSILSKINE